MDKSGTKAEQAKTIQSATSKFGLLSSSLGDFSASVTPKDVSPDVATSKDIIERKIHSDDLEERQEAWLDEAIELTFPASDPISVPSYERTEAKLKTTRILEKNSTSIVVPNTQPDAPRVTLFGQLDDGDYAAAVMDEDAVPYTHYWTNAIDQVMVYIEPDDDQLKRIVAALNKGSLEFSRLQDFGSSNGGISTITVS